MLTKADTLKYPAFSQLKEKGLTAAEAMLKTKDTALQMLKKLKQRIESNLSKCKYPPKAYLSLACKLSRQLGITMFRLTKHLNAAMNQNGTDCEALLRCTIDTLDVVELQKLLVSTQQISIDLNIEYGVKYEVESLLDYIWVTLIYRELARCSKRDTFDKKAVEAIILSWMPFKVRKTYTTSTQE